VSQKKQPKRAGGIKLEPLKGKFFDIKPAKSGGRKQIYSKKEEYWRFVGIATLLIALLIAGNAYLKGKEFFHESRELAYEGYQEIQLGVDRLLEKDLGGATSAFSGAGQAFDQLHQNTRVLTLQADSYMKQNLYLDSASLLLKSAQQVAELGAQLSVFAGEAQSLPAMLMGQGTELDLMPLVQAKRAELRNLMNQAHSVRRNLAGINRKLFPEKFRGKLDTAEDKINQFIAALQELDTNFDVLLVLLGDRVPHSYLVLFQNNHELRATGGFIGSYMLVDINDGKITKMEAKDVYETDGQLSEVVEAPPGINEVADRLYMRDANYSPDFPTSAAELMWFLEASRGPSVDTVIAIDPTLIDGFLELTGPLELEDPNLTISADNFTDIISFYTEAKISEGVTPKKILFDLVPRFVSSLGNIQDLEALVPLSERMRQEKHFQLYSKEPLVQSFAERWGFSGRLAAPREASDFLSVITTAIGGNKSDQYIKQDLRHKTAVAEDGSISNELTIRKEHQWGRAEESMVANLIEQYGTGKLTAQDLYYILGRGPNVDYMRVYVPLGSQLVRVRGVPMEAVQVSEDLGYTVFGFKFGPVEAFREGKEVTLSYRLPYHLSFQPEGRYQLIVEKQAGSENVSFEKQLTPAAGITLAETANENFLTVNSQTLPLDQNLIFRARLNR